MSDPSPLSPGSTPPALRLPNQDGTDVDLADLRGGTVVVYFYPKAFTPGCTTEACDFRDNLAALRGAGIAVLGISADPVDTLKKFATDYELNYDLLSDADSRVAKEWGAWGERTINGETSHGPLRSTVVVDADGRVQSADYRVDAKGHVAALREKLIGA